MCVFVDFFFLKREAISSLIVLWWVVRQYYSTCFILWIISFYNLLQLTSRLRQQLEIGHWLAQAHIKWSIHISPVQINKYTVCLSATAWNSQCISFILPSPSSLWITIFCCYYFAATSCATVPVASRGRFWPWPFICFSPHCQLRFHRGPRGLCQHQCSQCRNSQRGARCDCLTSTSLSFPFLIWSLCALC